MEAETFLKVCEIANFLYSADVPSDIAVKALEVKIDFLDHMTEKEYREVERLRKERNIKVP